MDTEPGCRPSAALGDAGEPLGLEGYSPTVAGSPNVLCRRADPSRPRRDPCLRSQRLGHVDVAIVQLELVRVDHATAPREGAAGGVGALARQRDLNARAHVQLRVEKEAREREHVLVIRSRGCSEAEAVLSLSTDLDVPGQSDPEATVPSKLDSLETGQEVSLARNGVVLRCALGHKSGRTEQYRGRGQ